MHGALEEKTQCDKRKKTCSLLLNAFIVIFRSYPNIGYNLTLPDVFPRSTKKNISNTVAGT